MSKIYNPVTEAIDINYDNTTSGLTATEVQSAIDELGGISSGFTEGSVLFADASGYISEDNANLFWDNASNSLGIGTVSPGSTLSVVENDATEMGVSIQNTNASGDAFLQFLNSGGGMAAEIRYTGVYMQYSTGLSTGYEFYTDETNLAWTVNDAGNFRIGSLSESVRGVTNKFEIDDGESNYRVFQANVNTTNSTVTTLATLNIPTDTTVLLEAHVIGKRMGGTAGAVGDTGVYKLTAAIKNIADTVAIPTLIPQNDFTYEDQEDWNVTFTPNGTNIDITVQGEVDNNIRWRGTFMHEEN